MSTGVRVAARACFRAGLHTTGEDLPLLAIEKESAP